jgi:beta-galactosidase/beta-glucuronidase
MTLTHHLPSAQPHAQAWILGRPSLSLDGLWDFRMEHEDRWRVAKVPAPWQAQFDDLRYATGTALYRTRFTVPADWAERQVALCFGAVNYRAEVSLDGHALGVHDGGYLPFEFTLDNLAAEHELEVRVVLPSSEANLYPEPIREVLTPDQRVGLSRRSMRRIMARRTNAAALRVCRS